MLSDLPRGLIYPDENSEPDTTDKYADKIRSWREAAYEEAIRTRKLSPEEGRIPLYVGYLEGRQWVGKDAPPSYRSKFYINKTGKARTDSLSNLTDSRPAIEVSSSVEEFNAQADALDRCLRAEWMSNDMDLSLISAVDICKLMGTSFWKIGAASQPGGGHLRVQPCGSDCVMPIQPGMDIQSSTAVLYRTYKSLVDVVKKFPMRSADLEREAAGYYPKADSADAKPDHIDQYTWNGLAPQIKRMLGRFAPMKDQPIGNGFFKSIEWQEYYVNDPTRNESTKPVLMRDMYLDLKDHNWWYWVKPGQPLYPRKRLIIFAGNRLMYDGPAPYWHGLYPFSCLRLNPVSWSFWGLSMYRDLIPVNAAMNKIIAGVLDLVDRALKPQMIGKNTVSKAAWNQFFPDMPGGKLFMENTSANPAADIRYIDPPNIPAYVFQMLAEYLGPEFDKLAGIIDVAGLSKKMQVPGGDTIEQMRDSLQTSAKLESRYIETFLRDAGTQAISHVFQFFTSKKRMRILGADGFTVQDMEFTPLMVPDAEDKYEHWKKFNFNVMAGSMHGGARDRSKAMAISLRQTRDLSRKELYRRLEIVNPEQIEEELRQEMQEMAQMGMAADAGGGGLRLTRGQRNGEAV